MTRRAPLVFLGLLVGLNALLLVPAAPAGADRATYVAAADALCRAGQQAVAELGPAPRGKNAYVTWLRRSVELLEADADALRRLTPDPADDAAVTAMLRHLDAAVGVARRLPELAADASRDDLGEAYLGYRSELAAAEGEARSIGLRVCGAAVASAPAPGSRAGELLVEPVPDVVLPPAARRAVPVRRQDDGAWDDDGDLATSGTVPVAVSCLLDALGADPGVLEVAKALRERGAWTAGAGSSWSAVADYLRSQGLTAAEVTVAAVVDQLSVADGAPVLAAWRHPGDDGKEGALVLVAYDGGDDTFSAIDPTEGRSDLAFDELLAGDPWFLDVARP